MASKMTEVTTYEELCRGEKGYGFKLIDLKKKEPKLPENITNLSQHVRKLEKHITSIINDIEDKSGKIIIKFTIGKTLACPEKKKKFDHTDFTTWDLNEGVKNRWTNTYKHDYDGLIALAAITEQQLPDDSTGGMFPEWKRDKHQHYAVVLEQQLIHHYLFEQPDERLGNKSLDPGRIAKNENVIAGVVYMAYKLGGKKGVKTSRADQQMEDVTKGINTVTL
ncbi:uncharacterized protein LOC144343183 [Saccoglossus kowalevskii]